MARSVLLNVFNMVFSASLLFNNFTMCVVKTHSEGVVESMGNYIEIHSDKRSGRMDISDIGKEALKHWNGPPLARDDRLGEAALDRIFGRNRSPVTCQMSCVKCLISHVTCNMSVCYCN